MVSRTVVLNVHHHLRLVLSHLAVTDCYIHGQPLTLPQLNHTQQCLKAISRSQATNRFPRPPTSDKAKSSPAATPPTHLRPPPSAHPWPPAWPAPFPRNSVANPATQWPPQQTTSAKKKTPPSLAISPRTSAANSSSSRIRRIKAACASRRTLSPSR